MTRTEIEDGLTQWGIVHRTKEANHNYFPHESMSYKIIKSAIQIVDFKRPTTYKQILGELVGENKVQVGADSKHIDMHIVIAIDNIINSPKIKPFLVTVARSLYVDKPIKKRKNPDMILQAANKLNVGVQVIKTSKRELITLVANELELIL